MSTLKEKEKINNYTNKTRLVLVGGFLGSGKTTLMVALGKLLLVQGKKVALITNDQGEFLVDTAFARAQGFSTSEVLNGCFCCRFPDFMKSLLFLVESSKPDYIFAEPVGSCTDLLATVVAPLKLYYRDKFELSPLMIVIDAQRLAGEFSKINFKDPSSPSEFLLSHQLQEAQIFCLSKIDLVKNETVEKAIELLRTLNPSTEILPFSAKTGDGLSALLEILEKKAPAKKPIPLDYNIYAKAEAEFGWYNGSWNLSAEKGFDSLDFAMRFFKLLKERKSQKIAHAKLFAISDVCSFKLSLASGVIQSNGVCGSSRFSKNVTFTINVRAKCHPRSLALIVNKLMRLVAKEKNLTIVNYKFSSKVPPPSKPTFRIT
jgi:G3E family GTPase